jgi:hypothetical protein
MTDADPLDAHARSAAARLLAEVPTSPPAFAEAQKRSHQRAVRRAAVTTGLVAVVALGVAVPLYAAQSSRSDLEGPAAEEALGGEWTLPEPSEAVEVEVPITPTPKLTASPPIRPTVAARPVAGPWRARITGQRLVLRNPATDATVVQRIKFFAPGQFLVQEPQSAAPAAGFGCTADGEYSWDLDGDSLDVEPVHDPCDARVSVLVAGTWSFDAGSFGTDPSSTPDATESPTAPEAEETPTPTITEQPPVEQPVPSETP